MPVRKLKEYLDSHNVKYVTVKHSLAYTAQEIAESAHVSGKELAKTVVIKMDGKMAMAVLPASRKIDLDHLRQAAGAGKAEIAAEWEFQDKFPGCELGAMPPFGNLYGMDVFVAEELTADREIAFNAGSHTELIRMSYPDFENLVHPKVVRLTSAPWRELGS